MEEKENDLILLHLLILRKACIIAGLFFVENSKMSCDYRLSDNSSKALSVISNLPADRQMAISVFSISFRDCFVVALLAMTVVGRLGMTTSDYIIFQITNEL